MGSVSGVPLLKVDLREERLEISLHSVGVRAEESSLFFLETRWFYCNYVCCLLACFFYVFMRLGSVPFPGRFKGKP